MKCDYQAEINLYQENQLHSLLQVGEFCYIYNSPHESNLRVRLMRRLKDEGFACAVINVAVINTNAITLEQWYFTLLDTLVKSFNLHSDLENWWSKNSLLSPVRRFTKFVETVLLLKVNNNIVIFVDKIDSVLDLNFSLDDFFAVVRDCYNKRADKPEYKRITFVLIGVSTPSDLIQDKGRTPFNIGRAIDLSLVSGKN